MVEASERNRYRADSVKAVLKDLLKESARQVSLEDVQRVVSEYYRIPADDLKSRRRVKNVVLPRQVAMYMARELTQLSLPDIGSGFGGKDHTTDCVLRVSRGNIARTRCWNSAGGSFSSRRSAGKRTWTCPRG